jgi:hypothetical protein
MKTRPSAWWFAVGAGLLVAAVAVFVVVLVRTVSGFVAVDATVPADDRPHEVTWSGTERRMVWVRERDDASCTFTDPRTGAEVPQSPTLASYSKTTGSTSWVGLQTFAGTAGAVRVVCDAASGPVQVGPAPSIRGFGGGIAVAVLALVLLGLAGLVVLVVTGVLFVSRPPRRRPAAPPPSDAPAP